MKSLMVKGSDLELSFSYEIVWEEEVGEIMSLAELHPDWSDLKIAEELV